MWVRKHVEAYVCSYIDIAVIFFYRMNFAKHSTALSCDIPAGLTFKNYFLVVIFFRKFIKQGEKQLPQESKVEAFFAAFVRNAESSSEIDKFQSREVSKHHLK